MLYAQVVVGLPVEGPFDYIVPPGILKKVKPGVRVRVSFGAKKMVGYVVGVSSVSGVRNLKEITEVLDEGPVLSRDLLKLTKGLSRYYCCSLGEAIDTALPKALREGRKITAIRVRPRAGSKDESGALLIHDPYGQARWDIYLKEIREALERNRSALALFPDLDSVLKAKERLAVHLNSEIGILYRQQPKELDAWLKVREGRFGVVVGTRSAIFAPLDNLGLVIIDEEQEGVYKQDQEPHYHARDVAIMRVRQEGAKLILGATSCSLESFYLARRGKVKYVFLTEERGFPEVKLSEARSYGLNRRKKQVILSKYLEDSIYTVLNPPGLKSRDSSRAEKAQFPSSHGSFCQLLNAGKMKPGDFCEGLNASGKVLLLINRKGFATFASCKNCGLVLKCPRCNINLVYHFTANKLSCHYCNYKTEAPSICPNCNSGYIRYSGTGAERVESELSRIFPKAKIIRIDSGKRLKVNDADIFVATSAIAKEEGLNFGLIGVIGIDNSLNRVDLRSGEKTFSLLVSLFKLTKERIVIQTAVPHHICFQALVKKDLDSFYEEELKTRKQLSFPPYKHMILVKLRSEREERVKQVALDLFEGLSSAAKHKDIRITSLNPGQPAKLRGKFHWQVLMSCRNVLRACSFLKIYLKNFPHSGIIVTVDVDPL